MRFAPARVSVLLVHPHLLPAPAPPQPAPAPAPEHRPALRKKRGGGEEEERRREGGYPALKSGVSSPSSAGPSSSSSSSIESTCAGKAAGMTAQGDRSVEVRARLGGGVPSSHDRSVRWRWPTLCSSRCPWSAPRAFLRLLCAAAWRDTEISNRVIILWASEDGKAPHRC